MVGTSRIPIYLPSSGVGEKSQRNIDVAAFKERINAHAIDRLEDGG